MGAKTSGDEDGHFPGRALGGPGAALGGSEGAPGQPYKSSIRL